MPAECDTGLVQYAEADRALLAVLDRLSEEALKASLLLWSELHRRRAIVVLVIVRAKLLQIIRWKETGMQCKLTHSSQQAEHIGLHLMAVLGRVERAVRRSRTAAALMAPCRCRRFPTRSLDNCSTAS